MVYRYFQSFFIIAVIACASLTSFAQVNANEGTTNIRIGVVSFKTCVEQSLVGKSERNNFEKIKKEMEDHLQAKEKELNDTAAKFNDPDYLDSLSPEAEATLKQKFRTLSQEIGQQQQQYFQILNQANVQIVQGIMDKIVEASELVAKDLHIDLVINEETSFFYVSKLDITQAVIVKMDKIYQETSEEEATAETTTEEAAG